MRYKIYNQIVDSEILLPRGTECDVLGNYDIIIKRTKLPESIYKHIDQGNVDFISEQEMWFYLKDRAIFYVSCGERILVDIIDMDMPEIMIQSYITGSAMALALIQKGYLPIHGSTLLMRGGAGAVVISGRSGSGKSTVSMGLVQEGYKFLSDDVSAVHLNGGVPQVVPGFPWQKVCRDVVEKYGLDYDKLIYIDEDRDKFAYPVRDSFVDSPIELTTMIELVADESAESILVREIQGKNKLILLSNNIYRGSVFGRMSKTEKRMIEMVQVADKLKIFQIIHPKKEYLIDELVSKVSSIMLV